MKPRRPKAKRKCLKAKPTPLKLSKRDVRSRPQTPAIEGIPDYTSPITAYRVWQWDAEGIKSLNNARWTPGVAFEAKCPHAEEGRKLSSLLSSSLSINGVQFTDFPEPAHLVPNEDCTCGMYAGINLQHLINIGYAAQGIHGEVLLWGRLYEHSLGWRAQYAYPKFFIVPHNMFPWQIAEIKKRVESTLIPFNVDIYIQTGSEPCVGGKTIPLWIKDYGWSAQGMGYLVDQRKDWYDTKPVKRIIQTGDRIAVVGDRGGIGVIVKADTENIIYAMFTRELYRKPIKEVIWSHRNWRWETEGLGTTVSIHNQ
jgi:hypothetical protein